MAGAFLDKIDCESGKAYIDLKIKAEDSNTHFYLSEQNYRLSFNRSAFVPSNCMDKKLSLQLTLVSFLREHFI